MTSESNCVAPTAPRYRKIDLHTHILPEHMPDWTKRFGYGDFIRLDHYCDCKAKMYKGDKFFREIDENCYRTGPRVRDLNETGVDVQVLSTVPVMFNYQAKPEDTLDMARFLNDHIASICKAQPDRFVGLGTVPMQHAGMAIQELRRCVTELGLAGIQIGSSINEFSLCDKELFPIFEEAERLGACIFVHPWDMPGTNDPRKSKYWLPWLVEMPAATAHAICCMIFGGVFEKYPKLRVCFAHGGGSFPATIGRIEHGFNVRPDLVQVDNKRNPREYLGRFWVDSLVHDPLAMKFLLDVIGKDNVCLGSDYPFPLGEHHPGLMVEQMALPDAVKQRVLWLNGLSFLGLNEDRFAPPAQLPEPRPTSLEAACLHEQPPKDSAQSQSVQKAQVDQLQCQVESLSVSRQ